MNKAGCLYVAGGLILGLWLLGRLNPTTPSTMGNPTATPIAPPSAGASATAAIEPAALRATAVDSSAPTAEPLRAIRVFSPAEEARVRKYVPPTVKLREDVEFTASRRNATSAAIYVGQGREVSVVRVVGPNLVVEYAGRQTRVPIAKTDFLERVIAEANK